MFNSWRVPGVLPLFGSSALFGIHLFHREQEVRIKLPAFDHLKSGVGFDPVEEVQHSADFIGVDDLVAGSGAAAEQKDRCKIRFGNIHGAAGDCQPLPAGLKHEPPDQVGP